MTARRGVVGALIVLSMTLVLAPVSSAADLYEPNNSVLEAAGPLIGGQTYDAGLDASGDTDFFYFYVTSRRPQPVTLTLRNLGVPTSSAINAAIVDSSASTIDAFAYFVGSGAEATATVTLEPQKYFVEVSPAVSNAGTAAYSLTTGTGSGTFGPYSQISSRCATGQAAVTAAKKSLRHAQAKLQRATARLRRSLYGTVAERRAARANYHRAKTRVTTKRSELTAATRSEKPWCFIPQ